MGEIRGYGRSVYHIVVWCTKVIRRPYMFVYRSEKDHQELDIINVASALIEFSEETTSMIRVGFLCIFI